LTARTPESIWHPGRSPNYTDPSIEFVEDESGQHLPKALLFVTGADKKNKENTARTLIESKSAWPTGAREFGDSALNSEVMVTVPKFTQSNKYEHLVLHYGYHSNRSRGARRTAEQNNDTPESSR
jgi:hypothetical protein